MGMGKTCQAICVVLALFGRTGNREADGEAIRARFALDASSANPT